MAQAFHCCELAWLKCGRKELSPPISGPPSHSSLTSFHSILPLGCRLSGRYHASERLAFGVTAQLSKTLATEGPARLAKETIWQQNGLRYRYTCSQVAPILTEVPCR